MGCATAKPNYKDNPPSQVYLANFDKIWRAVQMVMTRYPLRVNNADAGLVETELIRSNDAWQPPFEKGRLPSGYRYRLTIQVLKGKSENQSATKVVVFKKAYLLRSFFSAPENVPSDGLEEKVILYRIGRELSVDRELSRAQKHNSN